MSDLIASLGVSVVNGTYKRRCPLESMRYRRRCLQRPPEAPHILPHHVRQDGSLNETRHGGNDRLCGQEFAGDHRRVLARKLYECLDKLGEGEGMDRASLGSTLSEVACGSSCVDRGEGDASFRWHQLVIAVANQPGVTAELKPAILREAVQVRVAQLRRLGRRGGGALR